MIGALLPILAYGDLAEQDWQSLSVADCTQFIQLAQCGLQFLLQEVASLHADLVNRCSAIFNRHALLPVCFTFCLCLGKLFTGLEHLPAVVQHCEHSDTFGLQNSSNDEGYALQCTAQHTLQRHQGAGDRLHQHCRACFQQLKQAPNRSARPSSDQPCPALQPADEQDRLADTVDPASAIQTAMLQPCQTQLPQQQRPSSPVRGRSAALRMLTVGTMFVGYTAVNSLWWRVT